MRAQLWAEQLTFLPTRSRRFYDHSPQRRRAIVATTEDGKSSTAFNGHHGKHSVRNKMLTLLSWKVWNHRISDLQMSPVQFASGRGANCLATTSVGTPSSSHLELVIFRQAHQIGALHLKKIVHRGLSNAHHGCSVGCGVPAIMCYRC
jgi:hypothetical protein